jgi:hypothetical protein
MLLRKVGNSRIANARPSSAVLGRTRGVEIAKYNIEKLRS